VILAARAAGAMIFCIAALWPMASQAAPLRIPIAGPEGSKPDSGPITDYPRAIAAIVRILDEKFALPIPRYAMEIYPSREEFEAALVKDLKLTAAIARTTAGFAKAAVGNRKVLVNEPLMATLAWPQRVLTLAHELVHATQLELADHRRSLTSNQWLVEGFAEWVAFGVTDSLGLDDFAKARERMIADVREVRRGSTLPQLRQLDSLEQWILTRNERGFNATYPLSFLIMDFLVEQHSFPTVVAYFRRFQSSGDQVANFKAAFGEDLDSFQRGLDRHLAKLLD
jgi:hypothetical protein